MLAIQPHPNADRQRAGSYSKGLLNQVRQNFPRVLAPLRGIVIIVASM